ncbi:vesicular acetylcholine transporter [Neodiprion virginianus]|uniref:vesicular acetylcholine transporter n=1 Tax=Neodiprion virginianus TaxID=2961670 RepID=UPI001EE76A92|nr:vesicular acetylcholine transporter [Neodiprion virginianus]XP_046611200.1 vesicular acetylcholine transporter [Neodiprion virginianus]
MTTIPIINMEFGELKEVVWTKLQEPKSQRKLILVIVSIALLLDNMLYMVIVPIIPDYLKYVGAFGDEPETNSTVTGPPSHHGQDSATGILFASKAIVQLMVNPFSGALIDRIGYDIPMMIGLTIMFLSTAVFACGRSYGILFFARSLQGVGSAFADTAGLAMIADRFTEEAERSKALGIALAFISFGCLVAPPFGGALYQFAGKEMPFLILAFVSLLDGFMLLLVMKPLKEQLKDRNRDRGPTIPIWRLFIDPYIAVCAGALMMSNVALAFLEPTISLWMEDNITHDNWKMGMIWLPAFFPHVFGVVITVKMAKQYPQYQWLMAACGLALEGLCCFIIPFSTSYKVLMIPICGICFGIALIDTALLPTLGYLVDVRYVSVYGSIYAIADISYSVAYAVGPIIAGGVVEAIGFTALNIGIAFSNLMYAPVLYYLRHIYDFKPFQDEANVLMQDPPDKEYQTYVLQEQRPVNGEVGNHLTHGRIETNIDQASDYPTDQYNPSQNGYEGSGYNQSRGYEQQPQGYGQQPTSFGGQSGYSAPPQAPQQTTQQAFGQQRSYGQAEQSFGHQPSYGQPKQPQHEPQGDANPFRRSVEPEKPAGDSNPFRQGMF